MAITRDITFLGMAALVISACAVTSPGPVTRDSTTVVDPHELVGLAVGPHAADRLDAAARRQGIAVAARRPLPNLGLELLTFRLPDAAEAPAAIRHLEASTAGVVVGRNHAYRPNPAGGRVAEARLYAESLLAWPHDGCPATLSIGVLDTPLDASAAGLRGVALSTRDFTGGAPTNPHGTAVAELLAGPGRLRDVRLYHAAVVGDAAGDAAAGVDDILAAVDWLSGEDVRLVNVSLAGPYNKILDRGLRAAATSGMVVIAAAGNDGSDAPPRYPAAFPFAIAVTAVDADLAPYVRAPRGDHIDFAAPGVDVYVPLGPDGRYLSGTSIATPFVTALAAAQPMTDGGPVTTEAVRRQLARNAVDIGTPGPDDVFGVGLATAAPHCGQTDRF